MSTASPPRVLVVDDSRVMRVSLRKILARDFEVLEAEDGEQAWEVLSSTEGIQLVFSDLSMPRLDGYGLLARVRECGDPAIRSLPVIIITGKEDDVETKEEVLSRGASDFISKPFQAVHVRARAASHLRHRRTQEKLQREATEDAGTGLGSARYLKKVAGELLAQIRRGQGEWIWLRLHVDGFRELYIEHGKGCCEEAIARIGGIISTTVRDGDHAATLGPGQFVLILNGADADGARVLAERLQQAVGKSTFYAGERELRLTLSVAISEPRIDVDTTVDDVLAMSARLLDGVGPGSIVMDVVEKAAPASMDVVEALLLVREEWFGEAERERLAAQRQQLFAQLMPLLNIIAVDAPQQLQALGEAIRAR